MIAAQRRGWAVFVANLILRFALRRRFSGFYLVHGERLRTLDPGRPVVAAANHSNWWDGFAILFLQRAWPERTFFLAQEERHLARYRFLARLGAFGLDLSSPRAGLREALRLLAIPNCVVWMFPQGALLPSWQQIEAKGGCSFLARKGGAQLLPVALRYEWFEESRPTIVINIGLALESHATPEDLSISLTDTFHELDEVIARKEISEFETLFTPRLTINRRWDRLRGMETGPPSQ